MFLGLPVLPPPQRVDLPRGLTTEERRFLEANSPADAIMMLLQRRAKFALDLARVDVLLQTLLIAACPNYGQLQDVELFKDKDGVTSTFVIDHASPVGMLRWSSDGGAWATGGLIGPDLLLTAGHAFDPWKSPQALPSGASGLPMSPGEVATQLEVVFDYQIDGRSNTPKPGVIYPIDELLEWCDDPDYAIVRLGLGSQTKSAGVQFGVLTAKTSTVASGEIATVVQHPDGRPKVADVGPAYSIGAHITYGTVMTDGASSGAPVLARDGTIAAVHSLHGCQALGYNPTRGISMEAIRKVSTIIP
jgi:hypothetical protein